MKEVMQKALDAIHLYLWAGDKHLLQDAHEALRTTLLQRTLPVQPEPLEYWNAVEGWVKIDEVREHFAAVNCGTIYKHGGEGRVPLYTASPQRHWVGLTEEERNNLEDALGLVIGKPLFDAIEAALKEHNHG